MPISSQTFTVGDGTSTEFTLQHELNSESVIVEAYPVALPAESLQDGERLVEILGPSAVRISFAVAPAANSLRIVIFNLRQSAVPIWPTTSTAPNAFMRSFNRSLPAAQKVMGETWSYNGADYPAIAVATLSASDRAALGGRFGDVNTRVIVGMAAFENSGVARGKIIHVRGLQVRIAEVQNDGDEARTLICGPVGVEIPRR